MMHTCTSGGGGHADRDADANADAVTARFFEAVRRGDERNACRLLKAGFDPDTLDNLTGASALGTAIEHEQRALTRLLLRFDAHPDRADAPARGAMRSSTALMVAAEIGDESAIWLLHGFGADMDCTAVHVAGGRRHARGRTALFSALALESYDAVRSHVRCKRRRARVRKHLRI